MAYYDYRCQDCGEIFTIERPMTESSEPSCTHCGSGKASRIWKVSILTGGRTPDVGQRLSSATQSRKSGCGSCSSHSCGTCH